MTLLLGYQDPATGSVIRTVASKLQDSINVLDFGADPAGINDSSSAFQYAIDVLSTGGGKISVPSGSYLINTTPNTGGKSIFWDFSPAATFSGTGVGVGKFPYLITNTGQEAIGPYIQSNSSSTGGSSSNGGVQAFGVEMLQPSSATNDQSVAIYAGATSYSTATGANIWAQNLLVSAPSGFEGVAQGLEIDVNNDSSTGTTIGLNISGVGSESPTNAIRFGRASGPNWNVGIWGQNFNIGIQLGNNQLSANCLISAQQQANGYDGIMLQRFTDTSPDGYFLRAVNAANSENIILVDVLGDITTIGDIEGNATSVTNSQTLPGTTAGLIVSSMPDQGVAKKFVAYANGYVNDSTTAQAIAFPMAFSNPPAITTNVPGLSLSVSTTGLTINAPANTTAYSGVIIVEGI